jgi:hypothetical protein
MMIEDWPSYAALAARLKPGQCILQLVAGELEYDDEQHAGWGS